MLRKKDMKPALKYGIIAAAWIVYLLIGLGGNSSNNKPSTADTSVVAEQTDAKEQTENTEESELKEQSEAVKKTPEESKTETPAEETSDQQQEGTDNESAGNEEAENEVIQEEAPAEEESIPTEFKNALKKATQYSSIMHMSKQGIYDQLTSEYGEGFPEDAAQYAIDNIDADWEANALAKAKE